MLSKRDLSNLPDWPRLLSRDDAAAYLGVSAWQIDDWRREGFISDYVTGTKRFDRHAIDKRLDVLSGLRDGPPGGRLAARLKGKWIP